MIQNYLHIMEESLQKKDALLDKITDVCERQEVLLKEDSFSLEEFDKLMETKGKLAEELNSLDDGFESLYEKIREQLQGDRQQYRNEIQHMQALIRSITDKSNHIQAMEERNRQGMEMQLQKERTRLQKNRQASAAAYNYYKNMSGERISVMDTKN
jgi:uncharacterized phage infection (PIP) family protein YhgE